jgi:hypothetical protein
MSYFYDSYGECKKIDNGGCKMIENFAGNCIIGGCGEACLLANKTWSWHRYNNGKCECKRGNGDGGATIDCSYADARKSNKITLPTQCIKSGNTTVDTAVDRVICRSNVTNFPYKRITGASWI